MTEVEYSKTNIAKKLEPLFLKLEEWIDENYTN
jgi:DNA-binding HxlR family transcriptional regulator